MDTIRFSCDVNTNIPSNPIHLQILLDDNVMFDKNIDQEESVSFEFDEDEGEHLLRFVISGKNDSHNIKDDNGVILDTTQISITNISFDDFDITNIIMGNPLKYIHDFNGTSEMSEHKFYDIAGCNGEIILKFDTPIYLWLLENM